MKPQCAFVGQHAATINEHLCWLGDRKYKKKIVKTGRPIRKHQTAKLPTSHCNTKTQSCELEKTTENYHWELRKHLYRLYRAYVDRHCEQRLCFHRSASKRTNEHFTAENTPANAISVVAENGKTTDIIKNLVRRPEYLDIGPKGFGTRALEILKVQLIPNVHNSFIRSFNHLFRKLWPPVQKLTKKTRNIQPIIKHP